MRCYSCRKYDDCERPWKCDGKMYDCTAYELEQTNEEYLRSLNTEQLATFLGVVQYDGTDLTLKKNHVEKWVEWLKQPHSEVGK